MREGASTFAAVRPDLAGSEAGVFRGAGIGDQRDLLVGVIREAVERHDRGQAPDGADVVQMAREVGKAAAERLIVVQTQIRLLLAAVAAQRADGGDQHHSGGTQTGEAALDVDELLRAQVRAEAGFCDHDIRQAEGRARRGDGVAAVGDIGEGTAVDEGGCSLQRLNEVWLDGLNQQGRGRAFGVQVAGGDGLVVKGPGDDDPRDAALQVGQVLCQTEDGHELAGGSDVETVLPGHAVDAAAEAVGDEAELAVVHVHAGLKGDPAHVDAQRVALMDAVVQHGGDQVVGCGDGVEVAGEVQVDILHGDDLGVSAAGGAALQAEDGTEGGLAQGKTYILALAAERVG